MLGEPRGLGWSLPACWLVVGKLTYPEGFPTGDLDMGILGFPLS
jgi:hypothetical protein